METTHTSQQLMTLLKLLDAKKMTPNRFTSLLSSGILADVFDPMAKFDDRAAFRTALNLGILIPDIFHLTVDYDQTLKQMIAAGRYAWKNNDITAKRFPIESNGIVEYKARYFHFNRNISSEDAIAAIKEAGWEPAKIEHVLSHGKTFPEEQRKFPIIGLGPVAEVYGPRFVPCLLEGGSGRRLDLDCWDDDWLARDRFLAVRKVSGA